MNRKEADAKIKELRARWVGKHVRVVGAVPEDSGMPGDLRDAINKNLAAYDNGMHGFVVDVVGVQPKVTGGEYAFYIQVQHPCTNDRPILCASMLVEEPCEPPSLFDLTIDFKDRANLQEALQLLASAFSCFEASRSSDDDKRGHLEIKITYPSEDDGRHIACTIGDRAFFKEHFGLDARLHSVKQFLGLLAGSDDDDHSCDGACDGCDGRE